MTRKHRFFDDYEEELYHEQVDKKTKLREKRMKNALKSNDVDILIELEDSMISNLYHTPK